MVTFATDHALLMRFLHLSTKLHWACTVCLCEAQFWSGGWVVLWPGWPFFSSGSSSPLGFFSLMFLQDWFANGFVVAVAKVHLFQFEICCHVQF